MPRRSRVFGVPPSTIHVVDRAVGVLVVDVDPGVRVDPLDAGHLAAQLDRRLGVELGGERVVGQSAHGAAEHSRWPTAAPAQSTNLYVFMSRLHIRCDCSILLLAGGCERLQSGFLRRWPYISSSTNSTHLNCCSCAFLDAA